ncbi:psaC [Symbiodinium sp. CCMP2592]|nr:psaC [Symbiodinium sp. CCMP2592]
MMNKVRETMPDLVVCAPMCGPWSSWTQEKERALKERQQKYVPMWEFLSALWEYQVENRRHDPEGRLLPDGGRDKWEEFDLDLEFGPEGRRDPTVLRGHDPEGRLLPDGGRDPGSRDPVYDARVDWCQFGSIDPQSLKPYKKALRVETNDPFFCSQVSVQGRCEHCPGSHESVEGTSMQVDGTEVPKAKLAAMWPERWMQRVLCAAHEALEMKTNGRVQPRLHEPCSSQVHWETVPVEVESTPEGLLRSHLGQATGDKYDYIYFEGASGSLSRELRSTLAKLHVVLGHVSNVKLKRMLHLNGAKDHILQAAGDLRCQICQMVTGPTAPPRAAYDRPQRFNQRVVADAFFIWDSDGTKYAVIHAVDAFSMYTGVFGPPDIVMTDAGSEFAAHTEALLRAFDVQHEMVPPTVKWRMGLAERHGAVLKLLVMKTVKTTTAKGYSETKECVLAAVAARNRQMRVGGFSPAQIVLGKDVAIPAALLQQISSGHFRYVLNQDLAFDEARRRNEEIRYAASQAFIWADGHETLRKAINSRSRHPRLEMLYEGAVIYFYDPPGSRKGNKLKGVPLEFVRLAALEEVEGSQVCQDALKEVEKELQGERNEVEEMMDAEVEDPGNLLEFSGDEEEEMHPDAILPSGLPRPTSLDDVPVQLHRDNKRSSVSAPIPPARESREPKKVRFDQAMEQAANHISKMKVWHWGEAMRSQRDMMKSAQGQREVFSAQIEKTTEELATAASDELFVPPTIENDLPVTGKPRLEFKWHKLDMKWKEAFVAPLKKAVDVYVDNKAVEAVEEGQMIPPEKILPSRFVLTNKSDDPDLANANLRARWVLAGHLDKEERTCAPSEWCLCGFKGYPEEIVEHLLQGLAGPLTRKMRRDLVRLTKGGFGLAESPRLWYRRRKRVLIELGLKELKLSPGTFVYFNEGELKGILTIHVDDLRMAFDPNHQDVLERLRERFRFGEWRSALEEVIKFCGRWEKQCPATFRVTISMDGQLNWMARQGRADLAFGISKLQHMAGAKDPETLKYLKGLVTKAREHYESYFQAIEGELKDMVFLAVTAAETMDQCDFVRAMMGEILDHQFSLPAWQWSANLWKEILVLDSKTGYDVLSSINNSEDRRLAIDVAILKEALYEPEMNRWVRWVPGMTIPADGLTKDPGNPMRDRVLKGGPWSLCDSPAASSGPTSQRRGGP